MSEAPQKRRFQFSLKVLLLAMGMFGVGLGMCLLPRQFPPEKQYSPRIILLLLVVLGPGIAGTAPGMVISYGFFRLRGAVWGSLISSLLVYPVFIAFAILLSMLLLA